MLQSLKNWFAPLFQAVGNYFADGGSLLAAALAYYVAVTLFPLLFILLSGVGVFLQQTEMGQDARAQILDAIGEQLSPTLESEVEAVLDQVSAKASLGGPFGVVILFASGILIFAQLDNAFDQIWHMRRPRSGGIWKTVRRVFVVRAKAFFMLLALGAVVLVVFVASLALSTAESLAADWIPLPSWATWAVEFTSTVVINLGVFTALYRYVPRARVPWSAALKGGLLATVIWEVGRQVLATYVIGQRYTSAYGVVGSFLAIMLWAFYAANVLVIGAEFAHVFSQRRQHRSATPGD